MDVGSLRPLLSSRQWAVLSIGGIDETHADTDGIEKDRSRKIDGAYPIGRVAFHENSRHVFPAHALDRTVGLDIDPYR